MIIPGNTRRTPANTFSRPESLNVLKVKIVSNANTGMTAKYRPINMAGESVIKKKCPANLKAKVAKNQIKKPMASTGRINLVFIIDILFNR